MRELNLILDLVIMGCQLATLVYVIKFVRLMESVERRPRGPEIACDNSDSEPFKVTKSPPDSDFFMNCRDCGFPVMDGDCINDCQWKRVQRETGDDFENRA